MANERNVVLISLDGFPAYALEDDRLPIPALRKLIQNGASAKPHGVIYIVSGAGGAKLYNPEQQADSSTWLPFTDKFFSEQNSFSVVDIDGKTFRFKQISIDGKELDSFKISK